MYISITLFTEFYNKIYIFLCTMQAYVIYFAVEMHIVSMYTACMFLD